MPPPRGVGWEWELRELGVSTTPVDLSIWQSAKVPIVDVKKVIDMAMAVTQKSAILPTDDQQALTNGSTDKFF